MAVGHAPGAGGPGEGQGTVAGSTRSSVTRCRRAGNRGPRAGGLYQPRPAKPGEQQQQHNAQAQAHRGGAHPSVVVVRGSQGAENVHPQTALAFRLPAIMTRGS